MSTLQEFVYALMICACGIAIGFAIFCHNLDHENDTTKNKKIKISPKVKIRYMRIKCNRMFNSIYRYFVHKLFRLK